MMILLHHWHTLGWIGLVVACLVALQVFLPGVLPAVLRWLIGTQWGRMLILAALALACMQWYGDARFSEGRASCMAEHKVAAESSRADAATAAVGRDRSSESIGDATAAQMVQNVNQGNAATQVAQERTRARIQAEPAKSGCAGPDAGIVRDDQAADARVRAAADRMQRVGTAAGRGPTARRN